MTLEGEAFFAALNDDLNTPQAISELHAIARSLNKADDGERAHLKARLLAGANLLGLLEEDPETWFQQGGDDAMPAAEIEAAIAQRQQAKADKDFARADEIRDELKTRGVILEDSRGGNETRRREHPSLSGALRDFAKTWRHRLHFSDQSGRKDPGTP